ncbi:MAG TPA: glycosyltransferase, partial [bacterium]|nr:glycosyltransferase [bacterium]
VYEPGHIEELHCHAYAYIHGNEVGGTNPALLKAMGCGNCVLALDVPFNREVLADAGLFFSAEPNDLLTKLRYVLNNPEIVRRFGEKARERVSRYYRWEEVIKEYEALFCKMTGRKTFFS